MTLNFAKIQGADWQKQLNKNFETIENATLIELASSAETITVKMQPKVLLRLGCRRKLPAQQLKVLWNWQPARRQ
jgi:hypothetical protein